MRFGDFLEDETVGLLEDASLLHEQMTLSIPHILPQLDVTKRYQIGWYIQEVLDGSRS